MTEACTVSMVWNSFGATWPGAAFVLSLLAAAAILGGFYWAFFVHKPVYVECHEERHHNHGTVWAWTFGLIILFIIGSIAYYGWLREPIMQFCHSLL